MEINASNSPRKRNLVADIPRNTIELNEFGEGDFEQQSIIVGETGE